MSKLTNDYYIQRHLIAWIEHNFVSVDAREKAYGEINEFLDEVAELGDGEFNYWMEHGWASIWSFVTLKKEGTVVRNEHSV